VAVLHLEIPKFSYADGSFEIGRFARAPIRVHAGFGLAVAVLTLPYWLTGQLSAIVLVGIAIGTVFASVFLHELAHAYVGDRYGVAARRIDLNLFGGVVEFRNPPHPMWQAFAIVIAGPLTNLALAAFAYTQRNADRRRPPQDDRAWRTVRARWPSATAMTGGPIWSPPGFTANWEAIQAARRGATYIY
jgi:Zn-dependent protease